MIGAALSHYLILENLGQGEMGVTGEAARFSAQFELGPSWLPLGMNAPTAE